jgi:serine/threonine protein kinase
MAIQAHTRISDRYVVGERLGQGRGSLVFRGEDATLKRPVALKLVAPEHAAAYRAALGATARIGHPAFVGIYDALEHDGQLAIVQECISGERFETLALARLAPLSITRIGRQMALALAHAHRQGIIHGDLVPAALFRDHWGALRINNVLLPPDTAYFAAASRLLRPGDVPWAVAAPMVRDDLRAMGVALWLLLAGRTAPPTEATGQASDWDLVGRDVPAPLRDIITRLIDPASPQTIATAEEAALAFSALMRTEEAQMSHTALPPWSAPLPRPDRAATHPTITAAAVSTRAPVPPPISFAHSNATSFDDTAITLGAGATVPTPIVRPPKDLPPRDFPVRAPQRPRGRMDAALWAAIAIGLFLFWLLIGYLVPGIFGR